MPPPPPPPRRGEKASAASKDKNEYIPEFISKKPFYASDFGGQSSASGDSSGAVDYLEHQRIQKAQPEGDAKWRERVKKVGPAATKYRKGACENCGSMSHKRQDCLSRPRARGAKWTGQDIQPDETIVEADLGWDAKRDRWRGYDPKEYIKVVQNYEAMEKLRKESLRRAKANKSGGSGDEDSGDEDEDKKDSGDKYAEEVDMGKHQSTATRQLRLREDTAKYLLNLDLDSARYDPKTRTMVDHGAVASHDKAAQLFAEEAFLRASGDAEEFEKALRLAWQVQERTGDATMHLQANPTSGALARKKAEEEQARKRAEDERRLAEKYGVPLSVDDGGVVVAGVVGSVPEQLRKMAVTESEHFVEYEESGAIKGAPKTKARSKYKEDVLINNHTAVWGSWWSNFRWGYACCHSFIKKSYCTGEAGKLAFEAAERQRTGVGLIAEKGTEAEAEAEAEAEREVDNTREEKKEKKDKKKKKEGNEGDEDAPKKRTLEEMRNGITEADMDEYRRKRMAADDPMAKLLGKDELVH